MLGRAFRSNLRSGRDDEASLGEDTALMISSDEDIEQDYENE